MPIELTGHSPRNPVGKRLVVEFWVWRPVCTLLKVLCADLFDSRKLESLEFGRGAGLDSGVTCEEVARRLEVWTSTHPAGQSLESGIRMTPEGRFVDERELERDPALVTVSPFIARPADLERFIRFLRQCGGFEAW